MPSTDPGIYRRLDALERTLARSDARPLLRVPSGAHVYNNAALSIANNTLTTLTFNSERYDTHGFHSTSVNTSRLTIPSAGRYLVIGQVIFASNATGYRNAILRANGSTVIAQHLINANATDATGLIVHTVWTFAAGDYAELCVSQTSGGSLDVSVFAERSPEFSIERMA